MFHRSGGARLLGLKAFSSASLVFLTLPFATFHATPVNAGVAGRTAGQFAVSATGSAQYSIPLWTPPGPRGIQPHVALTYDSRSGNGPFGVGWNLAGLSSITRCNPTYAQDASAAPITLTVGSNGDRFCLDGKRLRLTSSESLSTYGQDGTTYQTEVADFSNITAHGTAGNGPSYFTVQGADGLTYEYGYIDNNGNGANSRVLASGSQTALAWLLSKVIDRDGNNMVINYTTLTGSALPATILWTPIAAGSSSYTYTMQFTYGPTAGVGSTYKYVAGTPVQNTDLLVNISVSASGGIVRLFVPTFTASPTTGRYRLTQWQECADTSGNNCLAPTAITYQNGQAGVASSTTTLPSGSDSPGGTWFAQYDFNGDGHTDLVYLGSGGHWYVALGTNSGFGTPIDTGIVPPVGGILFGDVLGTGSDGILASNGGTFYYYQYNAGTNSFSGTSTGLAYNSNYAWYALADLNGDGLPELVAINGQNGQSVLMWTNQSSNGTPRFSSTSYTAYTSNLTNVISSQLFANSRLNDGSLRTLDFNGDGRADLVIQFDQYFSQGDYDVYTNIELLSNGVSQPFTAVSLPSGKNKLNLFFTNWNNDNCTDAVLGPTIYISGCNGSLPVTFVLTGNPTVLAAVDWDGDGRTDLIVPNGSTLGVYLSTGNGVSALQTTSIPYSSGTSYFAFDAKGDGLDDLGSVSGTTIAYRAHNASGQPPDLMTSVTDGFGVNATFTYVPLTQNNYTKSTDGAYPDRDWEAPAYVVSQVTASDGTGSTYNQTFWYDGAHWNLNGRGFDGFYYKRTYDSRTLFYDYQYYLRTFPYTGILTQELVQNTADSNHNVKQYVANYQQVVLDSTNHNDRHLPYVHDATQSTWELGPTNFKPVLSVVTTPAGPPDNYGNFASVTTVTTDTDTGSPYNTQQLTSTLATTVTPDAGANWCVNLPSEIQVTQSTTTAPAITRTVQYTPDYAKCRETQTVVEPSSNSYKLTATYGFDAFGNVNSVAMSGINVAACPSPTSPCTTSTNWGTTGQFPMSVTNALQQTTQYNYNFNLGFRTSVQDPNNLTTSWTPDLFGRITQENRPDGTYTTYQYSDCASSGCVVGSHGFDIAFTVKGSDNSVVTDGAQYLDMLDRTLLTKNRLFATGSYDRRERRYDFLGNVKQDFMPCVWVAVSTPCSYSTTLTHDPLSRLTQTQRPISQNNSSPQTTEIVYNGRTAVTTDAQNKTTTSILTPAGLLGRSQDHDGYYQSFVYDAFGSLLNVTDQLNNTLFTGDYDYGVAAFQRDATDMDLDISTAVGQHRHYSYDALGEPLNWSDARGNTFSVTWDALSRPLVRTEPDLTTTWTWGTVAANHEIGRLASVATNTASEQYSYDSAGRLSKRRINVGATCDTSINCDYDFSYNIAGLLDHLQYPQMPTAYRFTPQYVYQNSVLSEIVDFNAPSQIFWQANTTNARGQVTQETLNPGAHGIVTSRSIDAVTGWVGSIQSGVGGGATLQNESYMFDYVGNLTQRQNNNAGLTENAYYDDLYRLDHTNLNNVTNLQMHYDAMGNITSRSDIAGGAVWTYDPNHKHQVLTAGDSSHVYTYDNDGNAKTRNSYMVTWTTYNYPLSIASSGESVNFAYGADRRRYYQSYTNSSGTETTSYFDKLTEKVTNANGTDFRFYIYAGGRIVAIRDRTAVGGTVTDRYVLNDQQGSVSAIDSSAGAQYVAENFTAFGNRRNAATWSGPPTSGDLNLMNGVTRQGYTGQTVLGTMGLNHMNGRVQDPITGRFLSADPYLTSPGLTQNFNRYGYVYSNPLSFIDPTGFCAGEPEMDANGNWTVTVIGVCHPPSQSVVVGGGGVVVVGGGVVSGGQGDPSIEKRNDPNQSKVNKPQGRHAFCIPNTAVQGIAGAAGGVVGGAIPGLLTGQPELAIAGAVVGGVAGGVIGALSAQPASTPGMVAAGAAAMGGAIPNPGYGRATTGMAGAYIGYGVTTSMQASGYGPGVSNIVGGAAGGGIGGAGAAFLAGEALGGAIGIGALAGAAGAATAVGVTNGLNFLNQLLGCGGGG